jgi:hypothetical protein
VCIVIDSFWNPKLILCACRETWHEPLIVSRPLPVPPRSRAADRQLDGHAREDRPLLSGTTTTWPRSRRDDPSTMSAMYDDAILAWTSSLRPVKGKGTRLRESKSGMMLSGLFR